MSTAKITPPTRMSPEEAKKWERGLKIILDAINHHRAEVLTSEFLSTGKVHGNICPQTVGTSYLDVFRKGTLATDVPAYRSDPTSQPFNLAFQSTAWLQQALDIKCNNFADNKSRLDALNLCIKNAKSIANTTSNAPSNAHAVAAHDALLIPTSYVDDLESFIFVLADFCMRNSNTFRRRSEFPAVQVPKWIADPVSHAALIEKERILEHGICAWEHEPAELFVFSKLFEDLAKNLKRARGIEKMYRTIDEALRCGNRWSGAAVNMDDSQRHQLLVRRRIEVGRAYTFFVEAFHSALRQVGTYL